MSAPTITPPEPNFEVLQNLGSGATSEVHLVRLKAALGSLSAGSLLARKQLRSELKGEPAARAVIENEGILLEEFDHPALVRLFYRGHGAEGPYLLLENLPETWAEAEAAGPLPEPSLRAQGARLAGALAALHAKGYCHGDVKADNVRVDDFGGVVLCDLGFASSQAGPSGASPLNANELATSALIGKGVGSPAFFSPERAAGEGPSAAADVYALGILLFELATAEHPILGPAEDWLNWELDSLLVRLRRPRFKPPSQLAPRLSPFFDRLLLEVLQANPRQRPTAAQIETRLLQGEAGDWWRHCMLEVAQSPRIPDQRVRPHLTPLIGRRKELAQLQEAYSQVHFDSTKSESARGAAIWIRGAAGSGKSRLLSDFAAERRRGSQPPLYLYGRASLRRESRPFGTLLEILFRWLQLPFGSMPGTREEELLASQIAPRDVEALMAALAGRTHEVQGALSSAFVRWLLALAREQPVLMFLDDLHLAGENTLSAVGDLAAELPEQAIFLALGQLSDDSVEAPPALAALERRLKDYASRTRALALMPALELTAWSEEDVYELVAQLFHPRSPRLTLARALWKQSRGNPGHITEILRGLIERGDVEHDLEDKRARLILHCHPDALPSADTLDDAIIERLEKLDSEEQRWLERLAVIGGRLNPSFAFEAFGDASRSEFDRILTNLVRGGWIVGAGGQYRFARPALRAAIYDRLPAKSRRADHYAVAAALAREANGGQEWIYRRAYHLKAAGEDQELIALVRPHLSLLSSVGEPSHRRSLAKWGLEALERSPHLATRELSLELLAAACDAANRLGLRDEERLHLDAMADLDLDPDTEAAGAALVYILHGRGSLATGHYGMARGLLRNAEQLAKTAGDDHLRCAALRGLAGIATRQGQLELASDLAINALRLARTPNAAALAWSVRARIELLDGWVERSLRGISRAHQVLPQDDLQSYSAITGSLDSLRARCLRSVGRSNRALGLAQRAVRRSREAGFRRLEVEARSRLGVLMIDLDLFEEADNQLRDALYLAREIEDRDGETLAELMLGILLWERDDPEARTSLERATELARELSVHRSEALGLAVGARIARASGHSNEALDASARALELLNHFGAELSDRIVIVGTRALVLSGNRSGSEARQLVRHLRRQLREENDRVRDSAMRRDQRRSQTRLLEATLSPEGPLYPRTPLPARS